MKRSLLSDNIENSMIGKIVCIFFCYLFFNCCLVIWTMYVLCWCLCILYCIVIDHRDATRWTTAKFISRATCGDDVISKRITRSTPQSDMDNQSLLPPITQPQSEGLPNKNVGKCFFYLLNITRWWHNPSKLFFFTCWI